MVELKVDGKVYKKDEPTVGDWYQSLGSGDKKISFLQDKDAPKKVIDFVKKYLQIGDDVDFTRCAIKDVIRAHQMVQKEIIEAFNKGVDVWGKNEEPQAK
jgi:hypothetical protein